MIIVLGAPQETGKYVEQLIDYHFFIQYTDFPLVCLVLEPKVSNTFSGFCFSSLQNLELVFMTLNLKRNKRGIVTGSARNAVLVEGRHDFQVNSLWQNLSSVTGKARRFSHDKHHSCHGLHSVRAGYKSKNISG